MKALQVCKGVGVGNQVADYNSSNSGNVIEQAGENVSISANGVRMKTGKRSDLYKFVRIRPYKSMEQTMYLYHPQLNEGLVPSDICIPSKNELTQEQQSALPAWGVLARGQKPLASKRGGGA